MTVTIKRRPIQYAFTVGNLALTGQGFSNPMDLALSRNSNRVYVINRSNPFQAVQGGVRVGIVTLEPEYIGQFGDFGTDDGGFVWPTSLAVDSQETIYVTDEHRHDVQLFDQDGNFVSKFGKFGSDVGELNRPSGIAVDSHDHVYVVDHLNNRIQVFASDGTPIRSWGTPGSGPGEFNMPWGIAIDADDRVFVADWRNDRIQKFTAEGQYLASFGSSGNGVGQLNRPANLGIDKEGNLFVADWGNDRVAVFNSLGFPVTTLIGDHTHSLWGDKFLAANQDLVDARKIMADGTPEKRFWGPTAVEVDSEGRIIVVDSCRHRLQVYTHI